ncbi:MAG TPA: hemolysin III family protein [Acidimicrobiia bacterium]
MCQTVATTSTDNPVTLERPRLRGMLHAAAFVVSCAVGVVFVTYATGTLVTLSAAVFAGSVSAMLLASTLYHRVTWSPRARPWMRRLDHAGIYLLIAGTYTPVGLIAVHGTTQRVVLAVVWGGAVVATLVKFLWVCAPKWLAVVFGITLGWAGIAAMPQLEQHEGWAAVALLAAGGLAYTVGAIVYALRRPDPFPTVFGYHELFHALTLVALVCQYSAIAFYVVRVT